MKKLKAIFALIIIMICGKAMAMDTVTTGMSLEWLALCAPHIALGKVQKLAPTNKSEAKFTDVIVTIKRTEVLKGMPPEKVQLKRFSQMSARAGEANASPSIHDEYLLFFDVEKKVEYAVNLSSPAFEGSDVAISSRFEVLKTQQSILKVVRESIEDAPKTSKIKISCRGVLEKTVSGDYFQRVEVKPETEAYKALNSGGKCYLIVPKSKNGTHGAT